MSDKTCFKCNETKPLSEFYRHAMMAAEYWRLWPGDRGELADG